MDEDLKNVIETSTLTLHKGSFVLVKVANVPNLEGHFLVSRDEDEITVITKSENIENLEVLEKSGERSLFEVKFAPDASDAPGFLAVVCRALAEKVISVSIVSTFSKDYILVSKNDVEKAIRVLSELGFKPIKSLL